MCGCVVLDLLGSRWSGRVRRWEEEERKGVMGVVDGNANGSGNIN